ncbi:MULTISPECIES: hypothetical protein [unclassified Flavobacterium]|uniref:hypothetical protein n=1 Tax=unclassified Flavobacterium TaxID=196869 RepID=UPI001F13023F|nr:MULTISPECIES: hypothetical protein [unclassified Flavobacterium]UMY64686.1 hypothetical protein MKO97_09190 [Flavobacterium sp. HJ-32-4]
MRYKILTVVLLFQVLSAFGQNYKEIYFPGVDDIETLVIRFWLEKGGKMTDITRVAERTTFDNEKMIDGFISLLERNVFEGYKGERIKLQFTLKLINPKYENSTLPEEQCKELGFLKEGRFIYKDPDFAGIIVERTGDDQIETGPGQRITSKVKWISDCEFELINPGSDTTGMRSDAVIHVKVIGVLDNQTVVYRSTWHNEVFTGIMQKI